MATRRMVPVTFYRDPDVLGLFSREHRQILLSLNLAADDEGRGLASAKLISREMGGDYSLDEVEEALLDIADNGLIVLYQAGKHRYYWLTKWDQWQTIRKDRMIPSQFPAPPQQPQVDTQPSDNHMQESDNQIPAQFNLIESNLIESNVVEGETSQSNDSEQCNVVPFPTRNTNTNGKQEETVTQQVAEILKIPVTAALTKVVEEFAPDSPIAFLCEADAAREYIDAKRLPHPYQAMTPAFFRRWLQRERGDFAPAAHTTPAAQPGNVSTALPAPAPASRPRKSLMGLEEEYRRQVAQRETECNAHREAASQ